MPRHSSESEYTPSTLPPTHVLARLGPPKGSHNFTSIDPQGVERLVELPSKIRRVAFAARGMFVFVQLYDDDDGRKLAGEITHIVTAQEVKAWRRAGEWPSVFDVEVPNSEVNGDENEDDAEDVLPENPNRRAQVVESSDEEDDEESDDDEE